MALQDLKKLITELEKLCGVLKRTPQRQRRQQIHKEAFSIIHKIERGEGL
ncbi:MAG: hypothetical protein KDD34_01385 [Bdellovibrionales bacterium]|nr:hypothetical protein [Bdellovibrionales bacterium]